MIDARAANSERQHPPGPGDPAPGAGPSHRGAGASAGSSGSAGFGDDAATTRIELLTRAGCHLCDDARQVIARVGAELGVSWRETDVDADPAAADAYGDRVPVVLVDGREHGYWRVEEERLRRALAGDRWSWRSGRSAR
ncbi:glutaredoxin family protein [Parafrankia sp. FMc2]|uniref:glutaredoxin family protein n=1 Tax=Parafrankia sp. FMc2 TaxID=3233196 RepID=UPI0034D659B8